MPGKDEVLARIEACLPQLRAALPLRAVYLFGSYARGEYAPGSDVDVLVVYEGETRGDAYSVAWDALDIPSLQLHVYSSQEYEALEGQSPGPLSVFLRDAIKVWPKG